MGRINLTKATEIPVHCWNCGNQFYIEIANVKAGHLFCSEKCWKENLEKEKELEEKRKGGEKIE